MPEYCAHCHVKLDMLPYTCKFCGQHHCKHCQLPEDHQCKGLEDYKEKKRDAFIDAIAEAFGKKKETPAATPPKGPDTSQEAAEKPIPDYPDVRTTLAKKTYSGSIGRPGTVPKDHCKEIPGDTSFYNPPKPKKAENWLNRIFRSRK
ncbi:MAG: AN1-type zinc finger protein [archaeon]